MKKRRKRRTGIQFVIFSLVAAVSILTVILVMGKLTRKKVNIDNSVIITQKDTPADMTEIKDTHEGMVRSLLSGQWVSKEDYQNVPYAVMYSNIYDAMPQSDIGQADVVFESPVEGGITRMCCLFENKTDLEKIGPVRSCRTYFLLFAKEFEAVYVHFGYSEYAAGYLQRASFHSLDGMNYCNFYRSSDRVAPHNAYTSWDGITESAEYKGYKLTYPDGFVPPFTFNTDDSKKIVPENGASCKKLDMNYPYNDPWFEYDEKTGKYLRYQFGAAQIDRESGEQLSFDNILIKYVTTAYYENGTPNYKIYGSGKGLFVSNGYASEVTWIKESESEGATKYYYGDGTEIVMNPGKTYVALVENTSEVTIKE